jgi:hypothetical protein
MGRAKSTALFAPQKAMRRGRMYKNYLTFNQNDKEQKVRM